MDNSMSSAAMSAASPFFLVASSFVLLFMGAVKRFRGIEGYAALTAAATALFFLRIPESSVSLFGGMAVIGWQAAWMWGIILASLAGAAFISISIPLQHPGIYYFLLFLSASGCMLTAASDNLFFAFLSSEIASVPLYFLVSCRKGGQGLFAAYKFSLSGMFLSSSMLLGLSFLNYSCPSLSFAVLAHSGLPDGIAVAGFILFSSALCLKMSAVPFNLVCRDVFSDSPAAVAAFMSSAWAVSALPVLYKIYSLFYYGPVHNLFPVLAVITALFGAYMAFYGGSMRKIAFGCVCFGTGFSILSFADGTSGNIALFYHLPAFAAGSAALFLFSFYFEKEELSLPLSGLAGFLDRHPVIAFSAAASLFSAAGLPPFGGFFAKIIILFSLLEKGHFFIACAGCIFIFLACWCSIRIVSAVFFHEPEEQKNTKTEKENVPLSVGFVIILLAIFLAFYGIFSSYFLEKISVFAN